jgi:hypothetical protein
MRSVYRVMPGCDPDPMKKESGEARNEQDFSATRFHSMLRTCRGSLIIVSSPAAYHSTKAIRLSCLQDRRGRVDANIGAGLGTLAMAGTGTGLIDYIS